jgi:chemotaxis protein methyltransferase CheR
MFGVLALGHKESINFTPYAERFEALDAAERIYRRVS